VNVVKEWKVQNNKRRCLSKKEGGQVLFVGVDFQWGRQEGKGEQGKPGGKSKGRLGEQSYDDGLRVLWGGGGGRGVLVGRGGVGGGGGGLGGGGVGASDLLTGGREGRGNSSDH